ncbi:MAG: hypothetical protein ACRD6W_09660 [Nitrososphaerales archaeon]
MTLAIGVVACLVAAVAAVRSTWSPCGLSMLSTITPMGEQSRRNRFRTTAGWFAVGSVLGGAALGAAMAGLAAGYDALGVSKLGSGVALAVAALICAASDARLGGFQLPIHRRQVNEHWLDRFRAWVYGFGFGCQIGFGLATYIIAAALYLMIVSSVLSGSLLVALAAGTIFGLVRGASVLLGRRVTHPAALLSLHRNLARMDSAARRVVVLADIGAGLTVLCLLWPTVLVAATGASVLLVVSVPVFKPKVRRTPRVEHASS